MDLIDKIYTKRPFYGYRRITLDLEDMGFTVNDKRVLRLMRLLGLQAVYPKQNTSKPDNSHRKYPYLLRDLDIVEPNQVWCSDITYIRMDKGFLYLVAEMDWYSRYVISWDLTNSLESTVCVDVLQNALRKDKPVISNTDQGSQFTSNDYLEVLESNDIQISMDGRGRAFDNIFIERLWRTVKYEEVYLNDYRDGNEAYDRLSEYFDFYNNQRRHSSLEKRTPADVYFSDR